MKKILSLIKILILTILLVAITVSCKRKGPWLNSEGWISKTPKIELGVDNQSHIGNITYNDVDTPVEIVWAPTSNELLLYKALFSEELNEEDLVLSGEIDYKKDKFILTVETDEVFDGKYKEIVFYKK